MIEWLQADEVPLAWQSSDIAWWVLRDSDLARGTIPAKLFEAFACGVPVVAGQRGVGADMIKQSGGGIVVTPGDVVATAAAIERLLRSPEERDERRKAGRAWAEAHFDASVGVDRYERLMRSAAGH
jgi:glycosyltransferase involved in cell wall biosynthesis